MGEGFSRRTLFGAGAVAAGIAGVGLTATAGARVVQPATATEPFYGVHQAGVATRPQAYTTIIALDLRPAHADRAGLRSVMKLWSEDAARLTQGSPALADTEPELAADPARLTVTVGYGPDLFDAVGLTANRPAALRTLPNFRVDRLESRWGGGQLMLQLCADNLLTISHACRILTKNVRSMTTIRWVQRGYRNPASASAGASMRNLMGQVDGTANLNDDAALEQYVWDPGADQPWFAGGTMLVLRRIRAEMDTWDEVDRHSKELFVGRRLSDGAPLTGSRESDEPDFTAAVNGIPVIPENSHIALARHRSDGEQFLRRPYNYDDTPPTGQISDSGLLFIAYQRDPARQFVPVQQRLSEADALNPWITPVGSAVFAIPPGAPVGGYVGQQLLER
ncbi:Dyp-type peroxidase [Mycolicibacterium litorale]|uniref:Iron-dependent peroxidase n=1 Tax=Mycolicibacterium litorale TaxID=758802 RepID=A0AAD1IP27_9MYCO|nr:Dyp-type peroxidase [Mycolicibacterium litorale]MCV7415829.1 Dyp-type peroxidase [Mycolicibacterium litorale]TDY09080.1 dye decolorizing peroxidase [Mycolicibacterium litorale]BBY17017.1 iron-dependent peroxidase [Mycolicibacterium litorale]